jgi:hypothetical protein
VPRRQVLGLLEAERGQLANDLDHGDLVRADLGEDALNSVCSSARGGRLGRTHRLRTAAGAARDGDGRGGGDAVALLEALDELGELEDGHLVDRLEQIVLGQDSHVGISFVGGSGRLR